MRRSRALTALAAMTVLALVAGACGRHERASDDVGTTTSVTSPVGTEPPPSSTPTTAPGVTTLPPPPSTAPSPSTTPPPAGGPAVQIRRGNPDHRTVALTFDAGSDVGSTATILDTLAARGIRATFGMTGAWAEAHPDLVRRMLAEGHQLLNHSYDHPSFTGRSTGRPALTAAQRLDELARTESVLAGLGATARPWFRPPYGDTDASVDADIGRAGYRYDVLWTIDSLGWKGLPVDQIVTRCLDGAVPGAILLLHVGSASADGAALPAIIDGLQARGYGFDTVAGIVG
jgi:peptidoglycan/xylan/chitin deacetylase (PgdA/CDA1 family)